LVADTDFMHGHGFYVAPNWILGCEARLQSKPLVYHPHGMFEPWILSRSRWKKRIAHWLFEDANFEHAGLWRALTSKEADQIRGLGIAAPIIVCPNGIRLQTFEGIPALRTATAAAKTRRSLLFLARLHPKKGLDLLLRAWCSIPQADRAGWRMVIAGPDELNHRAEIESLAATLGVENELVFTGEVSGDAKVRCLAEADAFVLPSRSEGFSVAILEAMACRLPVLATTACNFPELGTEGGGWCVDPSVEGIAGGLRGLFAADEAELTQRGNQGRALVERRYTWPEIARTLDEACRNVFVKRG
jgi:glycosyltransferase involved in cell wall biosynthesis